MSRNVLIPLAFVVAASPAAAQSITQQQVPMQPAQPAQPAAPAQSATAPGSAPTTGAPIGPVAGATVYDPAGGVVGTIESVTAQTAVVSTGTAKGALPLNAFAAGPKGPVIALNKAQLEAAMQQASAASPEKLKSQLVAGAQVKGTGGAVVGTVKTADDQFVTLTTAKGDVRLPVSGFAAGVDGPTVGMTAEQLDAATPATASATTTDAAATTSGASSTTTSTSSTKTKTTKKRGR